MKSYLSVDEISTELQVNRNTIYKKIKQLGLDSKKLDIKSKKLLEDSVKELHNRRNYANEFEKKVKYLKNPTILSKSTSTMQERLADAKQSYNDVLKRLEEVKLSLDTYGTVLTNDDNKGQYQNPLVKTYNDLIKSRNLLSKEIQEWEDRLKLISTTTTGSAIDD